MAEEARDSTRSSRPAVTLPPPRGRSSKKSSVKLTRAAFIAPEYPRLAAVPFSSPVSARVVLWVSMMKANNAAEIEQLAETVLRALREMDRECDTGLCDYVSNSPFAGKLKKNEAALALGSQ
jgi:hypothetical protein